MQVGTLRKRYNEIITRMESRDTERTRLEREVQELRNRQTELTEKLDHFQLSNSSTISSSQLFGFS